MLCWWFTLLQCITLVDYYVPLFFLEVSMVTPEKFCESMHLCKKGMKISLPTREGTCGLCHHVVVEILIMLKDPNMQVITIFSLSVTNILLCCTALYSVHTVMPFFVCCNLAAGSNRPTHQNMQQGAELWTAGELSSRKGTSDVLWVHGAIFNGIWEQKKTARIEKPWTDWALQKVNTYKLDQPRWHFILFKYKIGI